MEQPRYVSEERANLKIKLDPARVKVQAPIWPHETVISVDIGDTKYEAMIPTMSLPDDHSYVPAQRVGRIGDKLVIVLPVGNDGTTKWLIPEDELDRVLVK